nr:DUF6318 family protein [uncultured Rothia sp.]
MPPEAKERTVEDLHAFLQYWGAAQNYMLLTGDTNPFMDQSLHGSARSGAL